MKNILLTFCFILGIICTANAYDCHIEGVYYDLNKADKTASVTYKNYQAYNNTDYKGFVTIPAEITYKNTTYSVTSIGESAFFTNFSLTGIELPNSIISIDYGAFCCTKITGLRLPDSLKSIGSGAFSGCASLKTITLPVSLTTIGSRAFDGCASLKTITLPVSLTTIGNGAFADSGIREIVIAPGMMSVIPQEYRDLVKIDYTRNPVDGYNIQVLFAEKPFASWEDYYTERHKKELPTIDKENIARSISEDIERWQKKGEFESTEQWSMRVNDKTRTHRIDSLKSWFTNEIQNKQNEYKQEYVALQQRYESESKEYYDKLSKEYISKLIELKSNNFKDELFELKPYDADNQSFMISTSTYGDILLPVPFNDAPSFKENWNSIKNDIQPTFVFNGQDAVLSKLTFSNGDKNYVYDSHTQAKYAVADIKYNFAPIKVDDVDFDIKDLDIQIPAIAQTNAGQTVSKLSGNLSGIGNKTVEVERKSLTVGNGGGGGTVTKSDVDVSIPHGTHVANNTFALVIANENYRREGSVEYAHNDGQILAEYLTSVLGVPEKNLQLYCDASLNDIRHGVNGWLNQIGDAFGDDANIIVYYAGHGIPNEKNGDAYLLPVDGYGSDVLTGYSIKELYETLGALPSRQTLLLMDACFSGAQRDGSMMASNARGVRIKPKENKIGGNLIVISATQGDETAYPYAEQQHGMFTYFLLKKLKETNGNVTLGDLADYIITNVKRTSILNNGKIQTPTVSVSPSLDTSWKSLRLTD